MDHKAVRVTFCLLVVIGAATWSPVSAGLRDNNLIEIGMGSYAHRMRYAMLWPPQVKIYQDGTVVHYDAEEDKFYVSQLDAQALESLKKRLSSEQYFWKSRFIDMEGDYISVHGGVSYIRYLDGDEEILLATEVLPKKGPWVQLKKLVWDVVPDDHEQLFYPQSVGLETWEAKRDSDDPAPPLWPFSKQVELNKKLKVISHPEIIRYLFDQLKGIFSFFYWDFKDTDKNYSMALVEAPGWFEQKYLNRALEKVRKNGYRSRER